MGGHQEDTEGSATVLLTIGGFNVLSRAACELATLSIGTQ